jgi:hypothetical protein
VGFSLGLQKNSPQANRIDPESLPKKVLKKKKGSREN